LLSMLSESGVMPPEVSIDDTPISEDASVNTITEEKKNGSKRDSDRY